MKSNYEIYEKAAERIAFKWIRKGLIDDDGGVCMIGSFIDRKAYYAHDVQSMLPMSIIIELDVYMSKHYILYRIFKYHYSRQWAYSRRYILASIASWNDLPWRRKKTVVKIFKNLAEMAKKTYYEYNLEQLNKELNDAIASGCQYGGCGIVAGCTPHCDICSGCGCCHAHHPLMVS